MKKSECDSKFDAFHGLVATKDKRLLVLCLFGTLLLCGDYWLFRSRQKAMIAQSSLRSYPLLVSSENHHPVGLTLDIRQGKPFFASCFAASGIPAKLYLFLGQPLPLNQADGETLQLLPGIGPHLAQRIVSYRLEKGPFLSQKDLVQVPGIGRNKLKKLRSFVCFEHTRTPLSNTNTGAGSHRPDCHW